MTRRGAAILALALAPTPVAAQQRATVAPYIEVGQAFEADLNRGDVLTYTSIAAGADAAIRTRRAEGQLSYRYERRIDGNGRVGDQDVHSGLARVRFAPIPAITLEGGALATRARSDIGGAAPGNLVGNVGNVAQVYAVYGGPSLATRIGAIDVAAGYQIGFTKVEVPTYAATGAGPRRRDYFDRSTGQNAALTIGAAPHTLMPVGVQLSGGWSREDASQLDQRYDAVFGRADIVAPVSAHVALTGGAGYERIETAQRAPLIDAAGAPVVDGHGRFVTDPASPRRIAYRTDGLYYDAGVIWRPSRRTEVRGSVGRRYGGTSYTGSAHWQASAGVGVAVVVYDSVTTFGRQLRGGIASLPTSFDAYRDPFGQQFGGCTFGTGGAAPGGCMNDVFQSISTASYRARGIEGVAVAQRGRSTYGAGIGYADRRLFAPAGAPGFVVDGAEDESWYGQLFYTRALSRVSGLALNAFVNYYESRTAGSDGVISGGATGTYFRNYGRLGTSASLGLYAFRVGDFDTELSAQALIGAHYTF